MRRLLIIIVLTLPFALYLLARPEHAKESIPAQNDVQASKIRGKKVYTQHCMTCHQVDGSGVPNLNPPLIKTTYVLGDKNRLIKIILNGLNEEIEIDGEYYSNPMPPLNNLSDQEIADVLTYVRSSFGNKANAVTAAEVKSVRQKNSVK